MELEQLKKVICSRDVRHAGKTRICNNNSCFRNAVFKLVIVSAKVGCRLNNWRKLDVNKVVLDFVKHGKLRCQAPRIPAQGVNQWCYRSSSPVIPVDEPCCCPLNLFKTVNSIDVTCIWVPGSVGGLGPGKLWPWHLVCMEIRCDVGAQGCDLPSAWFCCSETFNEDPGYAGEGGGGNSKIAWPT